AEELRKLPVRVKECAGFIVNRVLMASMVEIVKAQAETGVSFEEIDALMKERAGVPMGPFLLADMLGLDIAHDVAKTLERAYGARFARPASLAQLVGSGNLGVKSGQGFYAHTTAEGSNL
ncbi:MAG: 3-hydroxyacyl-CoA dehydrogenase family protein, partial [Candidatus Eremiobacteraeota bacterium]|nr:3-hydroxyacyl-CoA dehydrogenase family protein [Candidatus Eremiobacteraeota bacterium]